MVPKSQNSKQFINNNNNNNKMNNNNNCNNNNNNNKNNEGNISSITDLLMEGFWDKTTTNYDEVKTQSC